MSPRTPVSVYNGVSAAQRLNTLIRDAHRANGDIALNDQPAVQDPVAVASGSQGTGSGAVPANASTGTRGAGAATDDGPLSDVHVVSR